MSDIPEHGREPVLGLPAELPPGERILWQGGPDWVRFAIRALHVRKVAIYFLLLLVVRLVGSGSVAAQLPFLGFAGLAVALLVLLAWLMARSALYTITTRRVVMRFGIAVPMSINLPYSRIESVELKDLGQSFGDIAIRPQMNKTFSYFVVWPHARPWRFSPLQPMMRCLPDARAVCEILADALGGVPAAADRPAGSAAKPSSANKGPRPFPLAPLVGAASLLLISILAVAWVRVTDGGPGPDSLADAVASIQLRFADQPDGSVAVIDADTGERLDALAPGTGNFLRATLRGLGRDRKSKGAGPEAPYGLYRIADGRLLLVDSETGRQIDLLAFGRSSASSFAKYLPSVSVQLTQASAAHIPNNVPQENTKVQETSP